MAKKELKSIQEGEMFVINAPAFLNGSMRSAEEIVSSINRRRLVNRSPFIHARVLAGDVYEHGELMPGKVRIVAQRRKQFIRRWKYVQLKKRAN